MRSAKSFLVLFLVLFLSEKLLAQTVRWNPPGGQLGFNQVSELTLAFEDCEPDGDPRLPQITGLSVGRPSQSSQTSIVNFKMTRSFSLIFPVRPGTRAAITIPSFEVQTDKGAIRVPAANFTVGDTPVGSSGLAIDDIAAASLATPKQTFWAGEVFPVNYSLNVLRRYYHSLASQVTWAPAPFVAEDWNKPEPNEVLIKGERRVVSDQTTRAYSKQPGTFTLKPASQMVNLMVGQSGFGFFAQASVEQRQLDTKPIDITIKPLPAAPADFSGAVGNFAFVSKVVPTTAAVGEPVTWTLELTGTGNWPDITGLPQREASNDFQVVQPKSRRTMKDGALFEGSLTEDVVLMPTRAGTYQLAAVRFTYFDTKSGTYKTITSAPVTVTITAQAAQPATSSNAPIQFSLPPATNTASAPELPTPVAPVAPENLPREPIADSSRGFVPMAMRPLVIACVLAATLVPLILWLVLAALRSKQRDPQRHRREALAKLRTALTELNGSAPAKPEALRNWQHHAASVWAIPHAAPGTTLLKKRIAAQHGDAEKWTTLWSESERALHGRTTALPGDWVARAETAAREVNVPAWAPFSLFAPRNLFPFLFALAIALTPFTGHADTGTDAYKKGDFATASTDWAKTLPSSPRDWTARHNLGLALAQQDRWNEAAAHWTSAFLLNSRSETTRWDLSLGLQRSGMAPPTLVELSHGEGLFSIVRLATPGEWQLILVAAALLLAATVAVMLLKGFKRVGAWTLPASLIGCLVAVVLASAATFSLHAYGDLANPQAVFVWKASTLRSIPTEADTTQKTSPLSPGSIAVAEKTFLGWTKLNFAGGQSGWARTEDLVRLYR
ncbi:BatD family protein [Oleiharenicola lentus]|uniref:BatD family protein n=1 Tax=Oleiharenicola lentus TaxID=2508720 RepID=UPI003F66C62F